MQPRGIRNNNPGNIRYVGSPWQGLADPPEDEAGFCIFTDPEYGLRAIYKTLMTYWRVYKLNTILGIANRWAPPSENNTGAYQQGLAQSLKMGITDAIDMTDDDNLMGVCAALVKQECGVSSAFPPCWYMPAVYKSSLESAKGD